MITKKTGSIGAFIAFSILFLFPACKEESKVVSPLSNTEIATAQDEESQDAISESIEQSIDNSVDALEMNNFSSLKAGTLTGISCSVTNTNGTGSSGDTTIFPKTVTLTYNIDTVFNNETVKWTGSISVKVELTQAKKPWRNYIKRTITFSDFTIANDSASFSVNGTRTMKRLSVTTNPQRLTANTTNFSLAVKDSVTSDLAFGITSNVFTGNFTRKAKRTREAIAHFEKGAVYWRPARLKDTIRLEGSVYGKNLMGNDYSRVITSAITITPCTTFPFNPVISSGNLEITNDGGKINLAYSAEECRTKVTLTKDDKVSVIERKLKRRYIKWW